MILSKGKKRKAKFFIVKSSVVNTTQEEYVVLGVEYKTYICKRFDDQVKQCIPLIEISSRIRIEKHNRKICFEDFGRLVKDFCEANSVLRLTIGNYFG